MFCDRDIICFLGDSITANGRWMAEVYQFLRKKYKIKCYNCGVSGGSARKAAQYVQSECLIYNPTYVVVMFGINDIERELYQKKDACREKVEKQKQEAIDVCISGYREIIKQVKKSGAVPIVCVPTPYDEVSDAGEENLYCQSGLDALENEFRKIAQEYDCPIVDFKKAFMPLLGYEGVMLPDRVHPTEYGQHILAQTFLCETGELDSPDFETPFKFEEWNLKRFQEEEKLYALNFIEFAAFFDEGWAAGKTIEETKKLAQVRYDEFENKEEFIPRMLLEYINGIDYRTKMRGEVIRLTIW